jgi:hypothetical protein
MICLLHADMELLVYMLKIKYEKKLQIFVSKFSCNLVYTGLFFIFKTLCPIRANIIQRVQSYNLNHLRLEKN